MEAIITKYHSPTNTRGSYFSAKSGEYKITIPYNYGISLKENHFEVMKALCAKHNWCGMFSVGELEQGYVFVLDVNSIDIW